MTKADLEREALAEAKKILRHWEPPRIDFETAFARRYDLKIRAEQIKAAIILVAERHGKGAGL